MNMNAKNGLFCLMYSLTLTKNQCQNFVAICSIQSIFLQNLFQPLLQFGGMVSIQKRLLCSTERALFYDPNTSHMERRKRASGMSTGPSRALILSSSSVTELLKQICECSLWQYIACHFHEYYCRSYHMFSVIRKRKVEPLHIDNNAWTRQSDGRLKATSFDQNEP